MHQVLQLYLRESPSFHHNLLLFQRGSWAEHGFGQYRCPVSAERVGGAGRGLGFGSSRVGSLLPLSVRDRTDSGGVCTIPLPDILTLVFTTNEQSVDGVKVASRAQAARQTLAYDRMPLLVFPLLSRFEGRTEFQEAQKWLDKLDDTLKPFYNDWVPKSIQARRVLERTKLPYIAFFSFGEHLPAVTEGTSDPEGLGYAYLSAASLIAGDFRSVDRLIRFGPEFEAGTSVVPEPTDRIVVGLGTPTLARRVAEKRAPGVFLPPPPHDLENSETQSTPEQPTPAAPVGPARAITLDDYQPTPHNLARLLGTRKQPSDAFLPGLLGTYGNDGWWFFVALAAEAWGLINLWLAARFNPVFVGVLFLLDLVGAGLAHACVRRECNQRNIRQVNSPDRGAAEDIRIRSYVPLWNKLWRLVGWITITGVMTFKLWGITQFIEKFPGPVFLSLIAAYLAAAAIHLLASGYVIFDLWRWFMWVLEKNHFSKSLAFQRMEDPGMPRLNSYDFECEIALQTGRFGANNKHELVKLPAPNAYEIKTFGTLLDREVEEVCNMQKAQQQGRMQHAGFAKDTVKRECIAMQFEKFLKMRSPKNPLTFGG